MPSQHLREHDLYPIVMKYLHVVQGVLATRINEATSSNNKGANANEWLHPDLAGLEDLGSDWHDEVKNCIRQARGQRARLWSFEVKLLINASNLRRSYFQAVSNSSWANFGYLVAARFEGSGTDKELRMLAGVHGIGVILIDYDDPLERSQILIPARERHAVDWASVNRLASENGDFRTYVKEVRKFYQTGEASDSAWKA